MLSVDGLCVRYGRARVLFDVGFGVPEGRAVALMGRNGAGKSTTLKAVMGLVTPERGSITFDGAEITGLPPARIARLGLGYVPEDRRIFPDMSVAENLAVGRRSRADGAGWDEARVFELFPELKGLRDRRAGTTSGGEQQMLALARTLMGNPRLLVLDEPSEGLAPKVVARMRETVADLKAEGLTLLLAEQNLGFARAVADDAVVLHKGHVAETTRMAALADDPELRRQYLAV
ncbi:amino acid/amide ABC transporter ATP-binding protein 2, HAAT family [Limimonas halophila]|uniref:Amino acid/amide ABC transporter ATP-binding protein 2, HAAT family n=1 Tax=Limimonas halophila TaxID=1082479 RepID=A0A1G7TRS2_9PROT|nr:ABC transporter ATP-binding protein [Limimonas halophila]SDG37359.1 amino acid/amide ABC transporter ATP-binding protein 2, HAAT family [Limimonas halophila]